jgi:DMSO/TMAO reductase YedYZ molybdopterin-dependent catalytic subunit
MAVRRGCWSPTCTCGRAPSGVGGIQLGDTDEPGFWESLGYHNYGDPWQEQRFWGD